MAALQDTTITSAAHQQHSPGFAKQLDFTMSSRYIPDGHINHQSEVRDVGQIYLTHTQTESVSRQAQPQRLYFHTFEVQYHEEATTPLQPRSDLRRDSASAGLQSHRELSKPTGPFADGKVTQAAQLHGPPKKTARDVVMHRPALAATHPANYQPAAAAARMMPPPPLPVKPRGQPKGLHSSTPTLPRPREASHRSSDKASASPALPWQIYTDPTLQSHSGCRLMPFRTGLGPETSMEPGLVISPTCMVGLPFNNFVEIAHTYPDGRFSGTE